MTFLDAALDVLSDLKENIEVVQPIKNEPGKIHSWVDFVRGF
jgi:hypothetical protein